mmetsp:Transcript_2634/g.6191  ORF Transcript_2634/g.6191 Transcript_2634/m.6191 type:complete len:148 (+) Transcript_2634:45-488(+)
MWHSDMAVERPVVKNTFVAECDSPRPAKRSLSAQPTQVGCAEFRRSLDERLALRAVAQLQGIWQDRREPQVWYCVRGLVCSRTVRTDGSTVSFTLKSLGGMIVRGQQTGVQYDVTQQASKDCAVWQVRSPGRRRGQPRKYTWLRVGQ